MIKILTLSLLLTTSAIAASDGIMTVVSPAHKASDFTLPASSGGSISLSEYSGKYVLINFWAHWCPPCIRELPDMQELYDQSDRSRFEIIAIHAGPFNREAAKFVERYGIKFPIVSDPDTKLKGWDVPALPVTYLVDPSGNVVYKAIGPREWNIDDMQPLLSN